MALDPWLGDRNPLITLFPVVALLAWYASAGPAVLSALIGVIGADWLFVSPRSSLEFTAAPETPLYLGYLTATGAVIAFSMIARRRTRVAEALAEQQHRALLSLERTRTQMQSILDNVPVVIYQIGADDRYVFVNRRYGELLDWPPEAMIGRHVNEVFSPEIAAPFLEHNRKVLETGRTMTFEERDPREDGEHVYVSIKTPIRDANSRPEAVLGISTDITAQKRAERQLRDNEIRLIEADRRKDEFLAMLSHELRNPLSPILTAVQLLKIDGASGADRERSLDIVERQATAMARLVDDLLDISRLSRGRIQLRRERVNLAEPIDDAVHSCRPLFDAAGHGLELELPEPPVFVDGDAVRLTQIVANLLNNAGKYTPPGGRITLTLERDRDQAVVRVADTGIGIRAEVIDGIFEMFTQVEPTLSRAQGGLGIGLALAQQLTLMHGGTIEARSEGTGRGSVFTVRLPVAAGAGLTLRADESVAPAAALRILVADDNIDAAQSLSLLLETLGHDVRTVHDGAEAVAAVADFRPSVALLDIGMPRLDGYGAARQIRALECGRVMYLVALTGWGQEEDRRRSVAAGFDEHLTKPLDLTELNRLLAEVSARGACDAGSASGAGSAGSAGGAGAASSAGSADGADGAAPARETPRG